jgi:hypothetical protein
MFNSARLKALLASVALLVALPGTVAVSQEQPTGSLTLVGHNPLMNRGMNAAIAIHGDYAYIGSRTDFYENDLDASGIMVVDISDPSNPEVVNVFGPPDTANPGESSRELRVWQSQNILILLHTNCGGETAHGCTGPSAHEFKFFDISGDNATDPELIVTHEHGTHEFFLWEDPSNPDRALMFGGSAGSEFTIWDISPVRDGQQPDVLYMDDHGYTAIQPNTVTIDAPSTAAGTYEAAGADFGPEPSTTGISGDVELVNDGVSGSPDGTPTDGCEPFSLTAGAIALVDRGFCGFVVKAANAQAAGASALIVANNTPDPPSDMGGDDPSITIPSVMISQADGDTIKAGLPATGTVAGKPGGGIPAGGLHSLSVSNDGRFVFYALLTGGFAVADVSDFTSGVPNPQLRLVTRNERRPTWPGPGAHSAVKLWGRDWVWVSDEVYGTITGSDHGCPWGWARLINIRSPERPRVVSEFKIPENDPSTCDDWNPPRTSYSTHNPTLTPRIAMTTWHSGGFQMANIKDPRNPYKLAEFFPEPLDVVAMEDPRLSSDPDTGRHEKVVMWSYPIIKDGLIYVVDLRNGLYILEYDGPFEQEIDLVSFLEGNSNLGWALCFEPVGEEPEYCEDWRRD